MRTRQQHLKTAIAITLSVFPGSAFAVELTCVRNRPAPYVYAEQIDSSQLLTEPAFGCDFVPLPYPCDKSQTPVISEWPGTPTQEVKLSATPHDPMSSYRSLFVVAQRLVASGWEDVWDLPNEPTDAVAEAKANGTATATFGVTGLLPGERYRFLVGWCKTTDVGQGCNCYSDPGFLDVDNDNVADQRPTTFPTPPLTPPTPVVLEDSFHRPATSPKRDRASGALVGGDGLGPGAFWRDAGASPFQNGSRIVVGSVPFAEIPENAQIQCTQTVPNGNGFAEVVFRPHTTSTRPNPGVVNYRVDARTRVFVESGTPYSYFAQVRYEPNWGEAQTEPRVLVFRGVGPAGQSILDALVKDAPAYDANLGIGCKYDGNAAAPLYGTGGLTNGGQVDLRVETQNQTVPVPRVQVAITLGWDCTSTGCAWVCRWKATDPIVNGSHPLYLAHDYQTGLMAHHWDVRVDHFRAGCAPTP